MLMASKYIKRLLTSLVIGKMLIKSTMKYHYSFIIISKIKKTNMPSVGKDVAQLNSHTLLDVNVKWFNHFVKEFGNFLEKVKLTPTMWPRHFTPRYWPKWKQNAYRHEDLYTNTDSKFICSNPKLKQHKCLSNDEHKNWYIFIQWNTTQQ